MNPRTAGEAERVDVYVARRQAGHDRCHFTSPCFPLRRGEVLSPSPWFEARMAAAPFCDCPTERDVRPCALWCLGGEDAGSIAVYRYPYRTPTPCPPRAVTGVCVVVLAVAVYYTAFFGLWGFGGVGSRRASGMASGDRGGAVAGEIEMQRWGGGRDLYRYLRPPTPGVCRKLILTRLHYYRTP